MRANRTIGRGRVPRTHFHVSYEIRRRGHEPTAVYGVHPHFKPQPEAILCFLEGTYTNLG